MTLELAVLGQQYWISTDGQAPFISQETKLIETVDANLTLDGLQLVASRLFRR